jgi:DNA-binding MarR family transcriptional regulator
MEEKDFLAFRVTVQSFIKSFGLLETSVTPCGYKLSLSQVFALQDLQKETLSVTQLSQKLALERSSVSRLVDHLVKEDFVLRESNPHNRREVILSLTERGESTIKKVSNQSVDFYKEVLSDVSYEDFEQMLRSFQRFTSLLKIRREEEHE